MKSQEAAVKEFGLASKSCACLMCMVLSQLNVRTSVLQLNTGTYTSVHLVVSRE